MTLKFDCPSFDDYQNTKFFRNLNGLRFLCIAAVLWHHGTLYNHIDDKSSLVWRGFLGVDFFFVLSGFLITTLLLREEDKNGRFSLRQFYIRRALRILPIYLFVVFLCTAIFSIVEQTSEYFKLIPFYIFFLSNFLTEHIPTLGITWSLAVEEQYYLLWPAVLFFVGRRLCIPILIFVIGVNLAISLGVFDLIGLTRFQWGLLLFKLPNATYAPILMGSLVGIVLHLRPGYNFFARFLGFWSSSLISLLFLLVVLAALPASLAGWPNLLIHSLMCVCLIALILTPNGILAPFLNNAIVDRIGQISYGMYLYHLLVLVIVLKGFKTLGVDIPIVAFFTYVLLTILVSEFSFRTLETYFQNLRKK